MAYKITYSCDCCGKVIRGVDGPLKYSWSSNSEPFVGRNGEVCSINCLHELVTRLKDNMGIETVPFKS